MRALALILALASPAAAQPNWLDDQEYAAMLVELKNSSVAVTAIPPVVVSGTVPISAATLPLPTGAATEATLTAISTTVPTLFKPGDLIGNSSFSVSGSTVFISGLSGSTLPVTGPLTDAQLRASSVPVVGDFYPAVQPVSGTFFQSTQPVSIVNSQLLIGATSALNVNIVSGAATSTVAVRNASGITINPATEGTAVVISTTLPTLFKAGQLIGNSSFSVTGSTVVVYQGGSWSLTNSTTPLNVSVVSSPNRKYYAVAPSKLNAASAATDNPMLMLVNLTTNTVNANIIARTMGCDVANVQVNYRTFLDPVVISSGTAIKPVRVYQGIGVPESQMQAYTLPTVSSTGLAIDSIAQGQNTPAAHREDAQTIIIAPGHSLLITADPQSNNRAQYISIRWLEE